jgi:hypothetical protein
MLLVIDTWTHFCIQHFYRISFPPTAASPQASDNGGYYTCEEPYLQDSLGKCIYTCTDTAPWVVDGSDTCVAHDLVDCADGLCKIVNAAGNTLNLSPKPWTNGDNLVATDTAQTGKTGWRASQIKLGLSIHAWKFTTNCICTCLQETTGRSL